MPATGTPMAGDVHFNRPLTNFGQRWMNKNNYVAEKMMPTLGVDKQSDLYWVYNRSDWFKTEVQERADGTESAGTSYTLSRDAYYCRVYALHKDVTDRQRDNADSQIKLDQDATLLVTSQMSMMRERLFLDAYMEPGRWEWSLAVSDGTADGGTLAVGSAAGTALGTGNRIGSVDFSSVNLQFTSADSDIVALVRAIMRHVQERTGYRPNTMLLGRDAYDALLDNDEILARIGLMGGATPGQPAQVTRAHIASLFELETVEVVDTIRNNFGESGANADKEKAMTFMVKDSALIYYKDMNLGRFMPTAGVNFAWTGFRGASRSGYRMKKFRMESTESDRVEAQMAFAYYIIAPELGFFLSNVNG